MKSLKKLFLSMLLFFCAAFTFAQNMDLYKNASKDVVELIQQADSLISQKKYLSAYKALEGSELKENEYILYKRSEVLYKYFCQNIDEKVFGMKDLAKKETLLELRKNGGSFEVINFDAEQLIKPKITKNTPILNLAMGNFYYELGANFYRNKPEYEKYTNLAKTNYDIAEKEGLYDSLSSFALGVLSSRKQDYAGQQKYFTRVTQLDTSNSLAWYNVGTAFIFQKKYKDSIEPIKKAISFEQDIMMLGFEYCGLAEVYLTIGERDAGIKTLKEASQKVKTYEDIPLLLAQVYLEDNDFKSAEKYYLEAIKINKDVAADCINTIFKTGNVKNAISISQKALKLYPKDEAFLGSVGFMLAQGYYYDNQKSLALKQIEVCRKQLKNAGILQGFESYLQDLENRCNQ